MIKASFAPLFPTMSSTPPHGHRKCWTGFRATAHGRFPNTLACTLMLLTCTLEASDEVEDVRDIKTHTQSPLRNKEGCKPCQRASVEALMRWRILAKSRPGFGCGGDDQRLGFCASLFPKIMPLNLTTYYSEMLDGPAQQPVPS
ncbi:hypothetical protein TNIN_147781 [Trichonephila inaurata madagascariensis]|uniref:Uncharacterized protein n=1 Tax=Trichonephila inaurata madagascariensis TaxID=2747483 RepID=A0A8X6XDW3_9ARAC|nr:hypothetical protein TNIN_147781 [Trichonephila inaurata madagascariensis]